MKSKKEPEPQGIKRYSLMVSNYFQEVLNLRHFKALYFLFSTIVLLASTLIVSVLGAGINQGNADQLANSFLFADNPTLKGALFPGQHTFLLKWPLFAAMRATGLSAGAFLAMTTLVVVATVGSLALVLYKIERRPLVLGTLYICLGSVLLLIPTQPYAGALLPANFAMLTTRNIEYVVFIVALYLILKTRYVKSLAFWLVCLLLTILFASDKLFLTLSLGASFIGLVAYAFMSRWQMVGIYVRWFISTIIATLAAIAVITAINASGLTHITSQTGAGPYATVSGSKQFARGVAYSFSSALTNLGANPADDVRVYRTVPNQLKHHLLSSEALALFINFALLTVGTIVCFIYSYRSLFREEVDQSEDTPLTLTVALTLITIISMVAFAVTDHYYPVDSRYIAIILFTIFIGLATAVRKKQFRSSTVVVVGVLITISSVLALPSVIDNYSASKNASASFDQRNKLIAQILQGHNVNILVGDYWRVLPIKAYSKKQQQVMPLATCTQHRDVLSSSAWQPDIKDHSFAYLLSFDPSQTDYKTCDLKQVLDSYGRPNSSTVIDGTISHPIEMLLFYDRGINNSKPAIGGNASGPATIAPISLDELPYQTCNKPTILNVVAHQDDDLLFLSPDLLHDIQAGHCVRTIYMTAGDAGSNSHYWLGREQGSKEAYSRMLKSSDVWIDRIVRLSDSQYITVSNPRGNPRISLIFIRMPDGNVKGTGFAKSHNESLQKIEADGHTVRSVDGQSSFTFNDLTKLLTSLMTIYQPTEIHTQSNYSGNTFPDHSDHMAVGRYTQEAYKDYELQHYENKVYVPIRYYVGYPVHNFPENVSGQDLTMKVDAFLSYAKFDGSVCHSYEECVHRTAYGAYLSRQYQNSY